jgi:iron(III) transport system substrate-binding protein
MMRRMALNRLPRALRRAAAAGWLLVGAIAAGCGACESKAANEVVAYTSVDQEFAEPVFRHCAQAAGLRVGGLFDTEENKSTGVLNRLASSSGSRSPARS